MELHAILYIIQSIIALYMSIRVIQLNSKIKELESNNNSKIKVIEDKNRQITEVTNLKRTVIIDDINLGGSAWYITKDNEISELIINGIYMHGEGIRIKGASVLLRGRVDSNTRYIDAYPDRTCNIPHYKFVFCIDGFYVEEKISAYYGTYKECRAKFIQREDIRSLYEIDISYNDCMSYEEAKEKQLDLINSEFDKTINEAETKYNIEINKLLK